MLLFRWVKKTVIYNKWNTILLISVSFLGILIWGIINKSIENCGQRLEDIYATTQVRMIIHRSDGELNLRLEPEAVEELENSGYFKESCYSSAFDYFFNPADLTQGNGMTGISELSAIPLPLDSFPAVQCIIGDQNKKLSYGECIAGTNSPAAQGDILLTLYPGNPSQLASEEYKKDGVPVRLKSVGQIHGSNIYINYDQYEEICQSLKLPITIYSAEFVIKDNKNIDEVYDYLSNVKIIRDNTVRATGSYKYQILDGILKENTQGLIFKIRLLKGSIPALYLISFCIGAGLTCLSIRFGRRDLFLMKSMGTSVLFRFLFVFLKQMVCSLTGSLPGLFFLPTGYLLIYLSCYLTGSAVMTFWGLCSRKLSDSVRLLNN